MERFIQKVHLTLLLPYKPLSLPCQPLRSTRCCQVHNTVPPGHATSEKVPWRPEGVSYDHAEQAAYVRRMGATVELYLQATQLDLN